MSNDTLEKIPVGTPVTIVGVDSLSTNKIRLLELGFTRGTSVTPLCKSPIGDPTAYYLKGCVIALRSDDAGNIKVKIDER